MISNKVFVITDLAFNLPNEFTGDIFDALEEVVYYHKTKKAKKLHFEETSITETKCIDELWKNDKCRLIIRSDVMECIDDNWKHGEIKNVYVKS